jgi:hypothetical protein
MTDTADKVMQTVSYAGATVSVASGLTLTEWGIVVGIITAFLTFAVNQVWLVRRDRRERMLHELEVKRLCALLPAGEGSCDEQP